MELPSQVTPAYELVWILQPMTESKIQTTNQISNRLPCYQEFLPKLQPIIDYATSCSSTPSSRNHIEPSFSSPTPNPATDQIFQTRLSQLLHNLNDKSQYSNSAHYQPHLQNKDKDTPFAMNFVQTDLVRSENIIFDSGVRAVQKLLLKNLKHHYQRELQPVSIKKKCVKRGRKRVNVVAANNFGELLDKVVLPKWTQILKKKTVREGEPLGQVTNEYLWIKVLRDMRDFYRMIFKSRFHRSEKREDANREVLVKIFLEELGIDDTTEVNTDAVFDFLYKAHYKARSKNEGIELKDEINRTPMRIYYYYNEGIRQKFLNDKLCYSLLFYFLSNFGKPYLDCIQKNLYNGVNQIILTVVN